MPGIGCGSLPVLSFRRITECTLQWRSRSDGAPLQPSFGIIYQFCGTFRTNSSLSRGECLHPQLVRLVWRSGRTIRSQWWIMAKLVRPTFRGWRMRTGVKRGVPGALIRAPPQHRGNAHQAVAEVLRGVQRRIRCPSDLCSPPTSGDDIVTRP
jgi:hypothetical protein